MINSEVSKIDNCVFVWLPINRMHIEIININYLTLFSALKLLLYLIPFLSSNRNKYSF